jgi:hypothetical protein
MPPNRFADVKRRPPAVNQKTLKVRQRPTAIGQAELDRLEFCQATNLSRLLEGDAWWRTNARFVGNALSADRIAAEANVYYVDAR